MRLAQDRLLDARGIVVEVEDGVGQPGRPGPHARRTDGWPTCWRTTWAGSTSVLNHLVMQPDLFGEAPAFRSRVEPRRASRSAPQDRAEAEQQRTPRSLPPVIT